MRMAQTRGGKRDWTGCFSSTKGLGRSVSWGCSWRCIVVGNYHQKSPDGVVEEDGGCEDEHCEADDAIELGGKVSFDLFFQDQDSRTSLLTAIVD